MIDIFEEAAASLKIGDTFGWNRVNPIEHISTLGYDDEKDFLAYTANCKGGKWYKVPWTDLSMMKIPHWSTIGEYTGTIVYCNGYVTTYPDPKHMPEYMKPKKKIDYDHYDDDDYVNWDDDDYDNEDYGHDDYNDDYGWWR